MNAHRILVTAHGGPLLASGLSVSPFGNTLALSAIRSLYCHAAQGDSGHGHPQVDKAKMYMAHGGPSPSRPCPAARRRNRRRQQQQQQHHHHSTRPDASRIEFFPQFPEPEPEPEPKPTPEPTPKAPTDEPLPEPTKPPPRPPLHPRTLSGRVATNVRGLFGAEPAAAVPQPPATGVFLFCRHSFDEGCRCGEALRRGEGDYCARCWDGGCAGRRCKSL